MNIVEITSLDDARISGYMNIKDRTLRGESLFIAEGELVTQRLAESRYEIGSVFVDQGRRAFLDQVEQILVSRGKSTDFPVYVTETGLLRCAVGYDFHLGIMATGIRQDQSDLPRFMANLYPDSDLPGRRRLVVLPSCVKPDNLGSAFRSSIALGTDGIILGHDSCDPLGRRALRTSMAATVKAPWVRCDDCLTALSVLKSRYGFQLVGTVLSDRAVDLEEFAWPERTALLLGNEYAGLDEPTIDLCDRLVRIPMQAGVDSLNVGVSAGIFLYQMNRAPRL